MKRQFLIFNFQFLKVSSQSGQIIIVMLLIMLLALSVGLALTQRSVTDVTTSTQVEQATRAFSAAEAGIQKALASPLPQSIDYELKLDNNSSALIDSSGLLPYSTTNAGIEYPKIGRETTAQFWFVNPSVAGPPVESYDNSSFDIYYGNALTSDLPAVEVTVVMFSGGNFYSKPYYFDSNPSRADPVTGNRFTVSTCTNPLLAVGILGNNRQFRCKSTVGPIKDPAVVSNPPDCTAGVDCMLILARVRFLYINENHSLALGPAGTSKFPPQVQLYSATGTSGQSQKQVQAFKVKDVILPWFDFALFSTNELIK